MTRSLTAAMKTEIAKDAVALAVLVTLDFPSGPLHRWTGRDDITFAGNVYKGGGDLLGVSGIEETIDLRAAGVRVELSGVPSATLSAVLTDDYQGRACKVWLGILDSGGALITEPALVFSGRLDTASIADGAPARRTTPARRTAKAGGSAGGEEARVVVTAESRLVDLGRPRERRYTD